MRVRLASVAASRRSAFSLRRRNFRTPAASSMMSRRSSGRALRTASIWPCEMMTCCWRPTPESRQQLLDVEQPARHAVDRVLAVARAVQGAGQRDLGEVDREDAAELSMVSDTSARPSAGRFADAGEDHVVHLLGPHRGRRLGAEHPPDGVDDVGLARPVRADDDGHPRFDGRGSRRSANDLNPLICSVFRNTSATRLPGRSHLGLFAVVRRTRCPNFVLTIGPRARGLISPSRL